MPDVVQAGRSHLPEIVFNDPSLPMFCQNVQGGLPALHLAEGVFIDDVIASCVLKNARRYPRLALVEKTFR